MQDSRGNRRSRSFKSKRFHSKLIALAIAAAILVCGCGRGSSSLRSLAPPPPPSIIVSITPNPATVLRGATQSFVAKVMGTTNSAVTWSVQETFGGTIDGTGLYTAPQASYGTFHVIATSQADSTASGIAAAVVPVPQVQISPAAVTLPPAGTQSLVATVSGLANTEVTWAVRETLGGVINGVGFYAAPAAVGFYHVVATSVEDSTITGISTISVTTSTGRFTATGSLQKARGWHTAALLGNGKVLVAGGANRVSRFCIGGIISAELYDPATSSFAPTGALTQPRYAHTATVLQNGQVLVAGGFGAAGVDCEDLGVQTQNSAELYNPDIGSFARTGSMDTSRGGHTATLLPNGTVLIAGGEDQVGGKGSASAELYDPRTRVFTHTGNMTVARYLHTATLLTNGKVIIVGGAPGDTANPTSTAEVYDPATGSFTPTGSMATAREEHTATLLSDGKVLIIGGLSPGSSGLQTTVTAELYDPSTGLFAAAGSMAEARAAHTATLLSSGNVLIAGGGGDNSTAELYDATTNAFTITGGMEVGRSGHSETLLPNGAVLVAGGTQISSAEVYFEDGNPWDY